MVSTDFSLSKITMEKAKSTDAKCFYCGKKLFECEKYQGSSSKSTGIVVTIKCTRCKQLNHFDVK